MEGVHQPQPEGARNDITSYDEPIIYETPAPAGPPVTFEGAVSHSPYELLRELDEHHLSIDLDDQRRNEPQHHLAELALSSAVVWWWKHWQPIMMHRALTAGASLGEVAEAAGTDEREVYGRWLVWADDQSRLTISNGKPSLDPAEMEAVHEHIRRTSTVDGIARQDRPEG